jgi:hypothetical protein
MKDMVDWVLLIGGRAEATNYMRIT